MTRKHTDEEIRDIISKYNLILDKYENTKSIYAHDEIGYKYHFTLSNISMGRTPSWLQHNPFAIENIKLYLQLNAPDYELLDDTYVSCKTKMRFICHKHEDCGVQLNTFDNIANNHHICKYCGYEELRYKKQISDEYAMQLCLEKNVMFVGKTLKNGQTYIQYKCYHHIDDGVQEMSLDHFKASLVPCRYCQISQGEYRVKEFLNQHNIPFNYQHTFDDCINKRHLEFDFYLPNRNCAIEYDGKQHYEPMRYSNSEEENIKNFELCKMRDEIKTKYCLDNGIKLIRIPYWEFNNIEQILINELIDI